MKILYLHQYFRKPSMNGGIRSYEFAKRLAQSGHEVTVITSDNENKFSGWKIEQLGDFEVHWISVKYDNSFSFFQRLWAFVKFVGFASFYLCKLKSDKLFVTSTPLTVAIPAIVYKIFKRKPYIFEVRDVWPEVPIALGVIKSKWFIKCTLFLERMAYKYADHIVALSPDMEKSILKRCLDTPVTVISNASDCHLFNNDIVESKLVLKLQQIKSEHIKVVFYTGAFGMVNNLRSLIKLSSFSSGEVAFVIIGEGREECELKEYAEELNVLNSTLYFLPSMNKNQLSAVHTIFDMAASTVLPIPELYANSANKVFDAFAAGSPLLINHGGWIQGLIDESGCGLVIENDPEYADYKKLKDFLYSETAFVEASVASAMLGKNKFDRELLYSKFLDVIAPQVIK